MKSYRINGRKYQTVPSASINAIVLKDIPFSENDADANELTARLNSLDCDWRSRVESHTAALVIRRENRPKAVDTKLEKC